MLQFGLQCVLFQDLTVSSFGNCVTDYLLLVIIDRPVWALQLQCFFGDQLSNKLAILIDGPQESILLSQYKHFISISVIISQDKHFSTNQK